jgi:hypothetical protein
MELRSPKEFSISADPFARETILNFEFICFSSIGFTDVAEISNCDAFEKLPVKTEPKKATMTVMTNLRRIVAYSATFSRLRFRRYN